MRGWALSLPNRRLPRAFLTNIMKDKLKKDLFEQRTKEYDDYYNRPSLKTSYTLAVIGLIGMIILLIGVSVLSLVEKVAESM